MLRVHGVRHQLLGPLKYATPGEAVVQSSVGQYVPEVHGVTEDGSRPGVRTARLFVTGWAEAQLIGLVVAGEGVQDGRLVVVGTHAPGVPRASTCMPHWPSMPARTPAAATHCAAVGPARSNGTPAAPAVPRRRSAPAARAATRLSSTAGSAAMARRRPCGHALAPGTRHSGRQHALALRPRRRKRPAGRSYGRSDAPPATARCGSGRSGCRPSGTRCQTTTSAG